MKNYIFFIDDNIWLFQNLATEKPVSLFDNDYLAFLKRMHDTYGTKTQLNIFYSTSPENIPKSTREYTEFNLSMMPDTWKDEWKANADWLKLAFHAKREYPDWPYINAAYEEFKADFDLVNNEIKRFAGEEVISKDMVIHWVPVSKAAYKVLAENGIKVLSATYGVDAPAEDEAKLSKGDYDRLNHNRTEATSRMIYKPYVHRDPVQALRAYNHIPEEVEEYYRNRSEAYQTDEFPVALKRYANIVLNLIKLEQVVPLLTPMLDTSYVGLCMHEQYYHSHFYKYIPEYCEIVETAVKLLTENGFKCIFPNEMLKEG